MDYKILDDKSILSLILGIYKTLDGFTDSNNTLEKFFESLPVKEEEIKDLDFFANKVGLTISEDAKKSKMTIFLIWSLYYILYCSPENYYRSNAIPYSSSLYFSIYRCFYKKLHKKGDGITEININNIVLPPDRPYLFNESVAFYYPVLGKTIDEEKDIYDMALPDSLKKIEGPIFEYKHFRKVKINEGLEKMHKAVFQGSIIEELILPSSVEYFSLGGPKMIYNLVINDFDKVDLESNYMRKIINLIFYIDLVYDTINIKFKLKSVTFKLGDEQVAIYPEDIDKSYLYCDYRNNIKSVYTSITLYLQTLISKKLNEKGDNCGKIKVLK